jgi:GT2 family glycosyltransferase
LQGRHLLVALIFNTNMPPNSNTAIVILNWNGQHFLKNFLPDIIAHSKNEARIIIADNASTDDSLIILDQFKDEIEIIKLDSNYGFTGGYNRALKLVNAKYYVLLNSDVEVTDGWINPLIKFMDENADVAACQPKIRSYSDRHLLEHAGGAGGFIDFLGYPFCRGRLYNTLEEDKNQYNDVHDVFWATGACMLIRANSFHGVNGLDEDFFAHMEEIDLCWRLQEDGQRICVVPQSIVYHVGGGTLPKSSSRKTYYNFRNNLMMLYKNLPASKIYWVIPIRLVLDGIAGLKFLFNGDIGDFFAVIKAHFSFYLSIPKRVKIRKSQQQKNKNNHIKGIYKRSIVADYYLFGKRHFSQLDSDLFT